MADQTTMDELRRLVPALIDDLRSSGAVPGIAVGEPAPRFTLADAAGGKVSLDYRLAAGPVVLVFYRGSWCPICNMHLRALQLALDDIRALGASLVAISPEAPDGSLSLVDRLALGFDVLSDTDQAVTRAYGLQFELPDALRGVYRDLGMAVDEHNADGSWYLPVPATFVLDSAGVVRARHVDSNYRERMTPDAVLEALRTLR